MPSLRRRKKSKREQASDLLLGHFKPKSAGKAAKNATKAAKGTAVEVSKRAPVGKRVPLVVGAAFAAILAAKLIHGRGGDPAAA